MKTFSQILEAIDSAARKPENYVDSKGKTRTRMVPDKLNLTKEEAEWDDMTRSELSAAIMAAEEILDMMDEGIKLERWQLSEIITASKSLTDVYINMSADNEDDDEEDEDE